MGVAVTAGGGADYDLPFWDNRFSIRLFEVDHRFITPISVLMSGFRRAGRWAGAPI